MSESCGGDNFKNNRYYRSRKREELVQPQQEIEFQ